MTFKTTHRIKYIITPAITDIKSVIIWIIFLVGSNPPSLKYSKYTAIPITIDAAKVFKKHIKYFLSPIPPILFLRFKNNIMVLIVAEIDVAYANPLCPIGFTNIIFKTKFKPTAIIPFFIGVIVSWSE